MGPSEKNASKPNSKQALKPSSKRLSDTVDPDVIAKKRARLGKMSIKREFDQFPAMKTEERDAGDKLARKTTSSSKQASFKSGSSGMKPKIKVGVVDNSGFGFKPKIKVERVEKAEKAQDGYNKQV